MLVSRRLDDQRYEEIVAEAEGRLPWLCPVWTDHNAHDPGITLLELMAWYKEMQQYQMDQMTPAVQRKLLELAGLHLLPARPAALAVEVTPEAPAYPALERLTTPQEALFELAEPVPAVRPKLAAILVERDGQRLDVKGLVDDGTPFQPFSFGGEGESALLLGFSRRPEEQLRLWFQVQPPAGVPRNAPDAQSLPPRTLVWELVGAGAVRPLTDETWALSWSGYVCLPVPETWTADDQGLWWLRLRQLEGGCEEQVRLSGVSAGRFRALQQETRAASHRFTVDAAPEQTVAIGSAQSRGAELAVFLRDSGGWQQTTAYREQRTAQGLELTVDASAAVADGSENLLVVCLDPRHAWELLLDARGLPGEELELRLDGQTALADRMELMCLTLRQDGTVRPALWHRVDDLSVCSPRDRAFAYDPQRERLIFGDGLHGAVVAPGRGAVLVTELVLSRCGGGNIPADTPLTFLKSGDLVAHDAAWGGRWDETLQEGRARLLKELSRTGKCLSAEDYEQQARETPGLRVAGAKALPGFDSAAPQQRRSAQVSVVVLPAGEGKRLIADRRFLEAVDRHLERRRTICIRTQAIPARYVPFSVTGRVAAAPGTAVEAVREALEAYFAPREARIGADARRDDVEAALQKVPGVLQVELLELRGLDHGSYRTPGGDLQIPLDGILSLEQIDLKLTRI